MKRLGISCAILLLFVAAPAATASITVASSYFVADAEVFSDLYGGDADHNEGFVPVSAYADVGGPSGPVAVATSSSNFFSVGALSAVASEPQHSGAAVSSATSMLFELTSDMAWLLDLEAAISFDFSTNGLAGLTAQAVLTDLADNPIYSYDVAVDGLADSTIFAAGTYNLYLYATSAASTPALQGTLEYANSLVELTADVSVIPVPGAALLCLVGLTGVSWLKKRRLV